MQGIATSDIETVLDLAKVGGFTGSFVSLGGGEVNNTYKLDCGDRTLILRVAKDEGQATLKKEAQALQLVRSKHVPELIYFDADARINNRMWVLESYLPGGSAGRLSEAQFYNLGRLLAQVHTHSLGSDKLNLYEQFLDTCRHFGNEEFLRQHPDAQLRQLINQALAEFAEQQHRYEAITTKLIHSDATPSNILVAGDEVSLIDWEFSKNSDPMCDFSTIYYEDIEYNQGKWRIKISVAEKQALFGGYTAAGGVIDEERIRFWIRFDKLTASIFLYWRIHQSSRETDQSETAQYQLDYRNLVTSLT